MRRRRRDVCCGLSVGPFRVDEALPFAEIAGMSPETVWAWVRPPEAALIGWPVVELDAAATSAFLHGQAVGLA